MTIEEKLTAASDAEQRGDYNHAEGLLHEVLEAHVTEQERTAALHMLGGVARQHGSYTLALEKLEEALAISVSISDRSAEAKARHTIGLVHLNLSDSTNALEYMSRALAIHEELGETSGAARVTGNIGNVHQNLSDYPKALEYYSRAHAMYEELGEKSGAARVTGNIGAVHLNLSDYPKALEYMSRALAVHEELGEKSGAARVTGNIGAVHTNLSDYPKALEYMSRALAMHEELGDKSSVASVTGNIGLVYRNLSDYPKALEYMSRALAMHEELGDKSSVASVTGNIGLVYLNLSDYPKALEYMSRALAMHEELGNKRSVAIVTGNIGEAYMFQGDHTSALRYYEQSLDLARGIGDRRQCAYMLAGIGSTYTALKLYDKAREYLHQALELRRTELVTNEGVAEILLDLGKLEIEEQNVTEATRLLEEACTLAHELGEKAQEYHAHEGLARAYELIGNIDKAYKHHKLFHSINKEVHSEDARKKAEQMEQHRRVAEMEQRHAAERAAADATTSLLHKVLPSVVADRLLKGEKVADYFHHVSILFADIVGFTPIAARMPAKAVLAFLNYVFGEFDRIMEKHGCQKIKTIGDGYMAVAGAPVSCEDHAERLSHAAIELMNDIQLPDDIRNTLPTGTFFHLRVGLHIGSAFAGIIGEKGFVYDIYSDAVNLAARMESSGEPGKIHCSAEFAHHLLNRDSGADRVPRFHLQERGEIEIKGKGTMRTYFLERA